jgi:hypothetical protein
MPCWQAKKSVHSDYQTQRATGKFLTKLRQRVDGERRTISRELSVINTKASLLLNRYPHHFGASVRIGEGLATVWWISTGEEAYLFEPQCLQHFERCPQMTVMNRVKCATEYAHGSQHNTIPELDILLRSLNRRLTVMPLGFL